MASTEAAQALREGYRVKKAALLQTVQASGASTRGIRKLLQGLAGLADDALRTLWDQAGFPPGFALVAVGGFGRGELFPHSDVDVLLLMPDGVSPDADEALKRKLEGFIGSCWDSGLEIGSSVRTLADCVAEAEKDVTVQTSLLESRLVAGSRKLYGQFASRFDAGIDPQAFFVAKTLELRQRHTKFENTPYSLEPNCKESPGGLRDLQVILWVAKAAGFGKTWDELARSGLATPFEALQIKRNEALLSLIRARLHLLAHRREDRLVFDLQTAVAESFGYANELSPDGRLVARASEALMKRYYWAAKAVTQLNQILLLNIEERLNPSTHEPRPINGRFSDKAGMLEVASDDLYQTNPHAILETFLLYQRTVGIKGLSARTLRALYNARDIMDGKFRNDPVNHQLFMAILQEPKGITHAMRLMNQTSVLGRYLWVFRKIVGQMQHDLFHVYTVDQHILQVMRNVRRFTMAEHAHEYPLLSRLITAFDRRWLLYLSALFHDIAKGRGGDHSQLGMRDARLFCRQHGLDAQDSDLVVFLVEHHLSMSSVAQKQDLSDPDVIRAFAALARTERRLTALYILTHADIRGTSPKVWNAWRGKLLEDLYFSTMRVLHGEAPHAAGSPDRQEEARHLLRYFGLREGVESDFWSRLDTVYFMRHEPDEIAWHTRMLYFQPDASAPVVKARPNQVGDGLQVMVYAPDQPDLFVRLCGFFGRLGYSIADAKIHTTSDGHALDSFILLDPNGHLNSRDMIALIETGLVERLQSGVAAEQPVAGRLSREVRHFPITPEILIKPDERKQHHIMRVTAADRPGLLYSVARVLAAHRINLHTAKITTLGDRAEDVFLISGDELEKSTTLIRLEQELLDELAIS